MARQTQQIASLFAAVGFKVDRKSLKDLETSLKGIEHKLRTIRAGFQSIKANQNFNRAFANLGKNAEGASKGVDKLTKSVERGRGPLEAYTGAINSLAGAMAGLRANMAGISLPRTPRAPTGAGGGFGGGRGQQQGFFTGALGGLFGGGAAGFARGLVPGLGAGWAVAHATTKAREMIATENALGALTGSQAGGRAEMAYLRQFSDQFGLRASESAEGYKRILASSVGTKLQGQGAKDIFEGTSLYGKTLGLSNENMSRATTAISQMISKGKISSEELKGQLAEAIPGAVQIFARAMNKPVAQMFKMMENGEVLAEDVLPKVAKLLKESAESGGALERSLKSSASAQNRFMNAWEGFLKQIFEAGLDQALASLFKGLTASLQLITPLLVKLAEAFKVIVGWTEGLIKAIEYLWNNPALAGVLGVLTAIAAISFIGPIMSLTLLGTTFAAVMMSLATWSAWAGRAIFFNLLPLMIILDTIEALAMNRQGIVLQASKNVGLHDALVNMFEDTLGGDKRVATNPETYKKQLAALDRAKTQGSSTEAAARLGINNEALARKISEGKAGTATVNIYVPNGDPKAVEEAAMRGVERAAEKVVVTSPQVRGR